MKIKVVLIALSLYLNLNANLDVSGDIEFWSKQFKEHAEFCIDFTDDAALKEQGAIFRDLFDRINKTSHTNAANFIKTSQGIKDFQNKVSSSLQRKDQDYKIKRDLVEHMNKETDYAVKRVSGTKMSAQDEIDFWNDEFKDEAHAMSYYMNSKVPNLKKKSEDIENQLKGNKPFYKSANKAVVEKANNELNDLGVTLDKNPAATRMPKKLAKHEERERQRARAILSALK